MIKSDAELSLVRQQLVRAELALRAIREEVRPLNESRFLLMAESYIEIIDGLRQQIDDYVGLEAAAELRSEISLRLEGTQVRLGEVPASLVARTIDALRRGLQQVVEAVDSTTTADRTGGRRKRWVEELCDLPLLGLSPGSVKIRLGEPEHETRTLYREEDKALYERVMELLRHGLACASGAGDIQEIPQELRRPVLRAVRKLVPPRRGSLESITFSGRAFGGGVAFRVTQDSGSRIDKVISELARAEYAETQGTIREVDLDSKSFSLRDRPNGERDLQCAYSADEEEDVKAALDKHVIIRGERRTSATGSETMNVDSIEVLIDVDAEARRAQ